jgi:hypothetical protein
MGELTLELGSDLQGVLEDGMTVVRASKSAAVRLIVPTVDPNREAAVQLEEIREGLCAAQRLLVWYKSNPCVEAAMKRRAQPSS